MEGAVGMLSYSISSWMNPASMYLVCKDGWQNTCHVLQTDHFLFNVYKGNVGTKRSRKHANELVEEEQNLAARFTQVKRWLVLKPIVISIALQSWWLVWWHFQLLIRYGWPRSPWHVGFVRAAASRTTEVCEAKPPRGCSTIDFPLCIWMTTKVIYRSPFWTW